LAALLDLSSPYNPSAFMLQSCILSRHKPSFCSSASRLSSRRLTPRPLPSLLSLRAIALGDGFAETASESSWTEISEGITKEQAEECSVMEAADLSSFFVGYMEFCNSQSQRLPRNAAKMLQALLSHPAGAQGFWTTFLTDPDLKCATSPPFDPALIEAIARFPELNMGVISSCLAMSATEEALYEGDPYMAESAGLSKARACVLIGSITSQPAPERGDHGLNWLLDLVDYDALEQARYTVELRTQQVKSDSEVRPVAQKDMV